jgi:glutathione S-transferase
MELYVHPLSATARAILLFEAESDITLDHRPIDPVSGEDLCEEVLSRNPGALAPVLDDGGFRLTGGSTILKYLADRTGSSAYPSDLRRRARVNERLDWISANLYPSLGYDLVCPQLFPQHHRRGEEMRAVLLDWAFARSHHWLRILDQDLIGPDQACLCGNAITIADYLGSALLAAGEALGCDLSEYPNIRRWLATMRQLRGWPRVFAAFDARVASLNGKTFLKRQANDASPRDLAA